MKQVFDRSDRLKITDAKNYFFNRQRDVSYIWMCARYGVAFIISTIITSQFASASTIDGRVGAIAERLEAASLFMCEISTSSGVVKSCGAEISIVESGEYNAWSRDGRIFLTRRLIDHSSDDELAYVIGHEMAHLILDHARSTIRNELEADYWSEKFMFRANFDVNAAKSVLSRGQFRRVLGFPFSLLNYPSNSRRLRTIRQAFDEDLAMNITRSGPQDGAISSKRLSAIP